MRLYYTLNIIKHTCDDVCRQLSIVCHATHVRGVSAYSSRNSIIPKLVFYI